MYRVCWFHLLLFYARFLGASLHDIPTPNEDEALFCNETCRHLLNESERYFRYAEGALDRALKHLALAEGHQAQRKACDFHAKRCQGEVNRCDREARACRSRYWGLQEEVNQKIQRIQQLHRELRMGCGRDTADELMAQVRSLSQEAREIQALYPGLESQIEHLTHSFQDYLEQTNGHKSAMREAAEKLIQQVTDAKECGRECVNWYYKALLKRQEYEHSTETLVEKLARWANVLSLWNQDLAFLINPSFQCAGAVALCAGAALGGGALVVAVAPAGGPAVAITRHYTFPAMREMCSTAVVMCLNQGKTHGDLQSQLLLKKENSVSEAKERIQSYLGKDYRVITNKNGDKVFISKDGKKRVRFDLNNPHPHNNPHAHAEELVNGKWEKSGPIYPNDVPKN